jgi:putative glutamine amidotransferase
MKKPIIGVTSSKEKIPNGPYHRITVPEAYTRALIQAGGIPLIIPLGLPEESLKAILPGLDGLLFTGGGDVNPLRYGSNNHALVNNVDEDRDRVELFLIREAFTTDFPFLGICRGLQTINVALGGTLYEDIQEQKPGSLDHQQSGSQPRDFLAHQVNILNNSRLMSILGRTSTLVNSLHHQAIRQLSPDLVQTAWAPDNIIEAIEAPEHRFAMAVQWHPESLPEDPAMQNLFRALVTASQP